jgi:hypothetical protein
MYMDQYCTCTFFKVAGIQERKRPLLTSLCVYDFKEFLAGYFPYTSSGDI